MSLSQRGQLFENTARAMYGVSQAVRELHIEHCMNADPAYGEGVRKALESFVASAAALAPSAPEMSK